MALIYSIREVDGDDESVEDMIHVLHTLCAPDDPQPECAGGQWWFVYFNREPIAFASLRPSVRWGDTGYLYRCGVLPTHRGNGLQRRLLRVRERAAKQNGLRCLVTDTFNNPVSANNLIRAGYTMFEPTTKWAFEHSQYWWKFI